MLGYGGLKEDNLFKRDAQASDAAWPRGGAERTVIHECFGAIRSFWGMLVVGGNWVKQVPRGTRYVPIPCSDATVLLAIP